MSSDGSGALRIGQALATSYAVYARNFFLFFLLAVVADVPNLVIEFLVPPQPPPWIGVVAPGVEAAPVEPAVRAISPWLLGALVLAGLALSFMLSVTATYVMIAGLRGTPFGLAAALASGLRALPPLLAILVLVFLMFTGFAMVVGLVWGVLAVGILQDPQSPFAVVLIPLFIVPVVIVALRLCLVVPVIVSERAGAIEAMKRSAELTKGHLWRILGLFIVAGLIIFVINAALFGGTALVAGVDVFFSPIFTVAKHAVIAAEVPFYWAVIAVIYYYLRTASERAATTAA